MSSMITAPTSSRSKRAIKILGGSTEDFSESGVMEKISLTASMAMSLWLEK